MVKESEISVTEGMWIANFILLPVGLFLSYKANTDSHCLLLYKEPLSGMAEERIKTMELTNDGFKIAEKDLELRGAGDIYGIRQSGLMDLKIANPIRDSELLVEAQTEALELGKNEKEFAKILVKRWISNRVDYSES